MPVQRNQPSPQRQTVLTFVSPNVQDLLFFETVDAQRVGKNPPAYGTAHPDTVNFPDHTLAYVKQADPNGQFIITITLIRGHLRMTTILNTLNLV